MIWVRSPWFDGFWLLSGIPFALLAAVLVLGFHLPIYALLVVGIIVFQTGHSIAPMVLAWSHAEFRRRVVLRRPLRYMVIPGCLITMLTVGGWASGRYWPGDLINPITWAYTPSRQMPWVMAVVTFHSLWNWWHFGRQNFGIMSIYRRKSGSGVRYWDLVFCCAMAWSTMAVAQIKTLAAIFGWGRGSFYGTVAVYVAIAVSAASIMLWRERCLPRVILIISQSLGMGLAWFFGLAGWGLVSMNHWLTAIGISAHTAKRPLVFPVAILAAGGLMFWMLFIQGWTIKPQLIGAGFGFWAAQAMVHFLYDGGQWKMHDPEVRETIGRDLFTASMVMRTQQPSLVQVPLRHRLS